MLNMELFPWEAVAVMVTTVRGWDLNRWSDMKQQFAHLDDAIWCILSGIKYKLKLRSVVAGEHPIFGSGPLSLSRMLCPGNGNSKVPWISTFVRSGEHETNYPPGPMYWARETSQLEKRHRGRMRRGKIGGPLMLCLSAILSAIGRISRYVRFGTVLCSSTSSYTCSRGCASGEFGICCHQALAWQVSKLKASII